MTMKLKKRFCVALLVTLFATAAGLAAALPTDLLSFSLGMLSLIPELVLDPLEFPAGKFRVVKPQEFDPGRTNLVQAAWLNGIGCPTDATIAVANAQGTGIATTEPFTDTA